ncbi:hypothetical protein [Laspinema olomoucense]|uniref:YopA central domain-containing protein n=1 Tax=Laspinema olomoucense D3b TaxID=2953688 RepID=A0ABT2N4M4_9CYAN|nr:hypothetical protein [Laspinema sp. D3b]MCT7977613.1 hypothetical protein [Laspinema sp. D3b]
MSQWLPKPKIIKQNLPNQSITLYNGTAELIDNQNTIEGRGIIQISWYPFPTIKVQFIYRGNKTIELKDVDLKLNELLPQSRIKIHLSGSTYSANKRNEIFGSLLEPFRQGSRENLSSLVFHINNFWWFNISNRWDLDINEGGKETECFKETWLDFDGQFIFDYDGWHIVLVSLDNGYLEDKLEAQGGYGVTHLCKIERLDGKAFDLEEGYEIVDAFVYYLSFVRGIWVAPLLVSGFDSKGNQILEEWATPKIKADSWQSVDYSWTTNDCTEIVIVFPGFMKKWQDSTWKEVIQNAIQWYIESFKASNSYNTSIVLIQAALEKLAWTYLKSNKCVTSEGFNGLKSSGQIRLLLKFLDIKLISSDNNYPALQAKEKELHWIDTIQAITEVRNAIVHPSIKANKSQILSEEIMAESFNIGHHYLLNCLIKLFENNE